MFLRIPRVLRGNVIRAMRLYVEPMDVTVVDVDRDGRVQLDTGEWIAPTLQEKRAIIYAARGELAGLTELVDVLEQPARP
jgi:hypothetical protein